MPRLGAGWQGSGGKNPLRITFFLVIHHEWSSQPKKGLRSLSPVLELLFALVKGWLQNPAVINMYLCCGYVGSEPLLGQMLPVTATKSQRWENSCPPAGIGELGRQ